MLGAIIFQGLVCPCHLGLKVKWFIREEEEQQHTVPEDVQNESISKVLIDSDIETAIKDVEINEPRKR